jgi:beta-glucuronidase
VLIVLLVGAAQAAAAPGRVPLDAGWRLRVGHPTAAGAIAPGPWTVVSVPSVFDARALPRLYDGTVGTYVLRFRAPAAGRWAIHFERVRRLARVYLNDRLIGTHSDPYSPFDVIARGLRPGRANVLRVVVDNRKPRGRREPFWNWGGIDRPVWLEPRGPVHLDRMFLEPVLDRGAWQLQVGGALVNDTGVAQTATIAVSTTSPAGTASSKSVAVPVAPHGRAPIRFPLPIEGTPELWSPAHPALYDTRITASVGGVAAEADALRTGLRTIAVQDGRLLLNGAPLLLRGAGISEDAPRHGDALTDADIDAYVAQLTALGANVTRAHYPLDERLLEKLDAAGILVWNEAPVVHADTKLRTAAGRADALAVLRRSLLATRNHPSVVADAVANELSTSSSRRPGSRAYLEAAVKIVRGLDPRRPVALDVLAYPGYPAQPIFRRFDVLGINAYFGWYPGRRDRPLPGVDKLGAFLAQSHARYPGQALVLSEFGAEAFRHGSATEKGTYEFQARYLRQVLDATATQPFMQGAIYWTLRDFAIKPGWTGGPIPPSAPRNTIFHKGLIARDGTPKPALGVAKDLFARWASRVGAQ